MASSVDPDQTAPLGAVWSGSTLFAQAYLSENLGTLQYLNVLQKKSMIFYVSLSNGSDSRLYNLNVVADSNSCCL